MDWDKLYNEAEKIAQNKIEKEAKKGEWKFIGKEPKVDNIITDSYFPTTFRIAYQQFWLTKVKDIGGVKLNYFEYLPPSVEATYESGYGTKLVINKHDFNILLEMEAFINHWFPQLTFIQIKEFK
jgi:hypothetical protein